MACSFDHNELKCQKEAGLVEDFLQAAQDWGELSAELEASERVPAAYDLAGAPHELEANGFFVFGAREMQLIEGGTQAEPSDWPIVILRILRQDNQAIPQMDLEQKSQRDEKAVGNGEEGAGASATPSTLRPRAPEAG